VALAQVMLLTPLSPARFLSYVVLGTLGLYTLVWVILPQYRGFRESYPGLAIDMVVSSLPLFLTGGLTSPFLLYSLSPIIYAALVFPRLVALGCACFNSASLLTSLFLPSPSQVNFGFAGLYVIACFLIGIMPYTTNLDIYRRLEQDTALKERRRLARELHDTVAQTLAYVNVKASLVSSTLAKGDLKRSLNELEQMKESLDSTYEEVRHTIETLGRSSPETVDFVTALSHQVKEFSRKSGIKSLLSVSGNEPKLSAQAADELLHIVGEAMVNARNHAHADTVRVGVNSNGDHVEVIIRDDGYGFNLSTYYRSEKAQNHHGITIMKERAESLGGMLVITSAPGNGTEVRVTIPLE
jgi:two-component sensor histidine kinase